MSRAGCPYDNAMAESLMKTLKHEEVDASSYRDLAHASAAIGEFIESAYNRQRLRFMHPAAIFIRSVTTIGSRLRCKSQAIIGCSLS